MSRALAASFVAAILALPGLGPAPALAQDSIELTAYGLRAGASLDDELTQLLVGGHLDLGRPHENLRVQSLLTLGFGDDALSFLVGGELHYLFDTDPAARIAPYAGGGLGLHHINVDEDELDHDEDLERDDSTEAALLLTAGFDVPAARWWGWFAEARFLIADESVFRLEGGVTWLY